MAKPHGYTIIRQCRKCGNAFTITQSMQLTCGPCLAPRPRVAPMLTCAHCGGDFKQKRGHPNKYCGQPCRYAASRKPDRDRKRNSWSYKAWREAVYERDDFKCQQCGSANHIQAHHKRAWTHHPELRYDVDNGVTLCRDCHEKVHGKRIDRASLRQRSHCADCGRPTKGRSLYCRGCGIRHSPKFQASIILRKRDSLGHYV